MLASLHHEAFPASIKFQFICPSRPVNSKTSWHSLLAFHSTQLFTRYNPECLQPEVVRKKSQKSLVKWINTTHKVKDSPVPEGIDAVLFDHFKKFDTDRFAAHLMTLRKTSFAFHLYQSISRSCVNSFEKWWAPSTFLLKQFFSPSLSGSIIFI